MLLSGRQFISANVNQVWEGLNDVDVLLKSIPGCEKIEKISAEEIHALVHIKIGPVRAKFSGKLFLKDIVPGKSCTLIFEGSGGAAGFAKGTAAIQLKEQDQQTLLEYQTEANIGGKLGQIGGRLIDASAKKLSEDFFRAFAEVLHPTQIPQAEIQVQTSNIKSTQQLSTQAQPVIKPHSAMESEKIRILWFLMGALSTGFGMALYAYFLR